MAGPAKSYDVVIVGGGINGLTVGAYLQKAGLKVAVFERRDEVGTGCNTEEVLRPGVRLNLCASGILTGMSPAYLDLGLEKYGLKLLTQENGYFQPFKDGKAFHLHLNGQKQLDAISQLSQGDAERFAKYSAYFAPRVEELIQRVWYTPPSDDNWARIGDIVAGCPGMPAHWQEMSGYELADALYESRHFKAVWLTLGIGFGIAPWYKGCGTLCVIAPWLLGMSGTVRGGSHMVPHALLRCLVDLGGDVFQGCPVEKIVVEDGVATGVRLSRHALYPEVEIRATKAVVSDLTPKPTFLNLIDSDKLPQWVVDKANAYDYNGDILFTNLYVLKGDHQWKGNYPEDIQTAFAFNFGVEGPEDCERLHRCVAEGILPDPPVPAGSNFQGFVRLDPTQAPNGYTVLLTWSLVPYNLSQNGGGPEGWDDVSKSYAAKVEDLLVEYGSNVREVKVDQYIASPYDTYRRNHSMMFGSWAGGPVTDKQFMTNRPFEGCGAPRTPIKNLYLSNGIWGHSTTMLSSGCNCAQVLAEDYGVREQDWWHHTGFQTTIHCLKRLGLA